MMAGYHDLASTLKINNRPPRNARHRKITIQAYNNQEVHITGGKRIPSNLFQRVRDQNILNRLMPEPRSKVVQMKLSDAGIHELGQMHPYGNEVTRIAPLEIFYNGEPLVLAHWPNWSMVNIISTPDGRNGKRFTYAGDRPKRWSKETDMWAYGFWYHTWADLAIKITSIDTATHTITLNNTERHGMQPGHYPNSSTIQGGYFRVVNVLSELDMPGEFYVDRTSGILYMWPPTNNAHISGNDVIYASIINDCINIDSYSSNIEFRGITLEDCRKQGIITGNVENLTLTEMEIKNTGDYNIRCDNCNKMSVTKSYFHDGDGGLRVYGGDRDTLTPSGSEIADNIFWRYSRVTGVGKDAVNIPWGVGLHVHHNHIYNGQYNGVLWTGNDHLIEYNNIHNVCINATDCGAIHVTRDWTCNNVHINIAGGRNNIARYNIFYNASSHVLQVDTRGTRHRNDVSLYGKLHRYNDSIQHNGIWAKRYPELTTLLSNHPELPVGNKLFRNIIYHTTGQEIKGDDGRHPEWFNISSNAHAVGPTDFYSPSAANFRPRCSLSQFVQGTKFPHPPSIDEVGPRYPVGPQHVRARTARHEKPYQSAPHHLPPCTTSAPKSVVPRVVYPSDGSDGKPVYHTPNYGCWFKFDKCPNHPELETACTGPNCTLVRDSVGERDHNAGTNATACMERVSHYYQWCGGDASSFEAIYGPTGEWTSGGHGCWMGEYGSVTRPKNGSFHRDAWAEGRGYGHNETMCLGRATYTYIVYSHYNSDYPVISIYRPNGHKVITGGGCWIKAERCSKDSSIKPYQIFYDAWGATNADTDLSEYSCLDRAEYFWRHCGLDKNYKVTAYYRPKAVSRTYP
ncbi:hypothetical protein FSP39_000560 [Pinctada imbricata]|uniref:Right handed beta helix domain-containing protein n=1 Tax=Pinctada imbricata TaxID=66713 RepID=A0AA88Y5V2_PINIB|nr:hypothetical protein FSP39_000560 [Pinctada imbricata]